MILAQTLPAVIESHPWRFIIPIVGTLAQSAVNDLQGFVAARREDHAAKFDWPLFGARLVVGAANGLLISLGLTVAPT